MQYQAVVRKFGPAEEVVGIECAELPPLARDKVRVRLLARSINPSDIITISGAYAGRTTLPFIPGFEAFGVVEECGEEVCGLCPGARVLPVRSAGGWQEFKDTDPGWCLRVPDALSDFEAATSYVNPMTAWLMLHQKIGLKSGMRIAINAAASSIGSILIGMANAVGVEPIAIVRSEASLARLRGRLEAVIIDKAENDLAAGLAGRHGLDAVLDCVGGPRASVLADALKPGGHFLHYGLLSGQSIPPAFWASHPDIAFSYCHLREWVHSEAIDDVQRAYSEIAAEIVAKVIATEVREVFPLEKVGEALRSALPFRTGGKVLLA
ncbi:zinc-dependent alcohol dehydrogenase family protein [Rhizobium lentis]|uniref:Zinc-dependent alcohol dehydrogenase family protein n=1 Tax=Rhizobium lentis TaxID=1138194 RepID=A0ABS7IBR0_9HYPH|nr:zinc-dependent alcohol dehydrogenase family protein [Rhizobium lentis]MBX4958430.1 zinc-dependent alcohol dehydrogenase family protein [Rhizobium lentis]MBX4973756.1 zinc-dependent alcohol dehydrogenase family protein [Rhizobium lentis]MBX4988436.1 zinc-dependent alcohol dehydrogenase family protein [Rhizobium lentis]MBX5006885.1 zinc-dependent alcohol dehydrogenase family protein [Rhizobium lentis]MBX5031481.1 zinc-dependent alcohol dehydrogenase family protein [Rhizobium lentis]